MKPVDILVPTLNRPAALGRALRSLAAQTVAHSLIEQVVVVDNSRDGGSRATVEAAARVTGLPMLYVHEPRPGVATARNAGARRLTAPLTAFLDDDQTAPPQWLAHLYEVHRRFCADVTFGPVRTALPDPKHWAAAYLERFFAREGPAESGVVEESWGCGNCMMQRNAVLVGDAPFDVACDQTGGEDDRLFAALRERGGRFAWSAEAYVFEHPPPERARMRYTLRRAFSYGQTPARMAADRGDWGAAAGWMAAGLGQVVVHGAGAAALSVLGRPSRAEALDRAARGLGKIAWPFTPRFYGSAAR